jgi:hypothetical protein
LTNINTAITRHGSAGGVGDGFWSSYKFISLDMWAEEWIVWWSAPEIIFLKYYKSLAPGGVVEVYSLKDLLG